MVECQLPKLNVAGSSPVPRFKIVSFPAFFLALFLSFIFGCASVEELPSEKISASTRGAYHKVRPGETLWRIAKMYDVNVEDIVAANKIPDVALIEKNQLLFIPGAKAKKEISVEPEKPFVKSSSGDFAWPLRGEIVSYFGEQKDAWINNGINIRSGAGEKVAAARDGRVVFADSLSGYGPTVILDHHDRFFTVYAQDAATLLVKLDDVVAQGAPLAESRGAHLHFEIRKNAVATNPLYYLP